MPQPKILITGGNGQVGFELRRQLVLHGQLLAPCRQQLDLANADAVAAYLEAEQPDLIINAAAYTAVDKAETDQAQATRLNAELPAQLADYCQPYDKRLVHYSSDYVYPGTGTSPWREDDTTGPQNIYGHSKLQGDLAVQSSGCSHLVFRTSWVYAARGNNFMKTMLHLGKDRTELSVVNDQIGAPTPARLIAQVTSLALERQLANGVYHLAPRGTTSWQQFAQAIFDQARALGQELAVQQVKGIPSCEYPTPAARPLNSRMSLSKLEQALGAELPHWQQQLQLTLEEFFA
ncbi:dTDP-4-dehydrorhamnose reductase [Oceanimonas doudoroffii]|uniref:dTDP-4-dehydrorhamnose reductase n=1 Tax=Oceanimonas doudoroffii TaxID=84158 RepID=A0A233RFF1_9GAMM|nr:dTDP-4-dehydrorhamnose reductase [Oceanimonas doudoroffii]OXY82117.1 dTDP-4-dehydrorhamnose reductase [Oceanimonas doudoroffii]